MTQARFFRARVRAGAGALLALALIAGIAAALVTGLVGAVRAFETAGALEAVEQASGDRDRVVVRFESDAGDTAARLDALDRAVAGLGAAGALSATEEEPGLFVLRPNPARFSGDAIGTLADSLPDLARDVRSISRESVQVSGGLRATLRSLDEGIQNRRGPTSVAIGIVGLLALVVAAAASVEPVRIRVDERALLRARGMSKGRLVRLALGEAIPVLLIGAGAGAAAGWAATWLWSGTLMSWMLAAAIALALVLVGALTVAVATLRGIDRRSVRGDVLAGVSAVVLLAVVAGLAAWQFWRAGSPVIVQGSGRIAIDPLIALAPGLVLALFALLAVVLSGPLAALFALLSARGRRVSPVTPLRLASRRTGRHALTTGAVAFAAATLALSLAYSGTLQALGDTPEEIRVGADVRVTSVPEDADPAEITGLAGVDAAMSARTIAVRGAEGTFPLLGVQPAILGQVMLDADGAIDPVALGEALALAPMGMPLPPATDAIEVTMRVAPGESGEDPDGTTWVIDPVAITLSVVLADADGALLRGSGTNLEMILHEEREGGDVYMQTVTHEEWTFSVPLPVPGEWRIVAVDAWMSYERGGWPQPVDVVVRAGGEPLDFTGFRGVDGTIGTSATGLVIDVQQPNWNASKPRVTRALASEVPERFPIVLTEDLAASMNARVGSQLSLRMASFSFTFDAEVAAIVPVLPGLSDGEGGLAAFAGLAVSTSETIVENELWLSTADPVGVAEASDAAVGGVRVATTDPRAAEKAFETALAFLLAAVGAVLLAVVVLVLRRSRGDGAARELGILAVLGLGRRGAVRVRAAEDAFAIALGVIGGIAAGLLAAWLVVPSLTRAAYLGMAESYPIALVVPVVWLAVALVAASGVFLAIAASVRAPKALAPVMREAE